MNSLVKHGSIGLSKNKKYLEHEDGTPFFWLADTWWYGMTGRSKWEDFKGLVADRKKKGFNVIQTVVGVPPEIDINSSHAENSGGLPFSQQKEINLKYFSEVDRKIKYLVDNGFVPCIFAAWGHHIDILGVDLIKKWWGEVVKRYAKYPVVWCLTGEADIFPPSYSSQDSLVKKVLSYFPNHLKQLLLSFRVLARILAKRNLRPAEGGTRFLSRLHSFEMTPTVGLKLINRLKKWDEVARYIKKIDKYKRLLTVHIHSRTTAAELFGNPSWLDIDSIQSGHSKDSLNFMTAAIRKAAKNKRPIINLEPWYEGILGNFGEKEQLKAFWACIKAGAAGHSYGAHGIWQMATYKDNFMGHWGRSDWRKAINYKGAEAIRKAKIKLTKNWPIIMKSDLV
ncbi:hypothetical protein A3A46_00550 [Candidatus Roizmanbacteria bacterium RIFCSPLOWO2_01_FULL_37_13]|nr:MAG: hypothetical protein A3A46_00550 [Candidatus Roizmanbacteria bacterium RIFCSPLOWO2_01_FULL_37_13]